MGDEKRMTIDDRFGSRSSAPAAAAATVCPYLVVTGVRVVRVLSVCGRVLHMPLSARLLIDDEEEDGFAGRKELRGLVY